MKKIKLILICALVCLLGGLAYMMLKPSPFETIHQLPPNVRDAFLARQAGLLYCRLDGRPVVHPDYQWVNPGVFSMGSDGIEEDFHQVRGEKKWENVSEEWKQAESLIKTPEDRALLLSTYKDELEKITLNTARIILDDMAQPVRDAWLAETAGLLYLRNGQSAYTGGTKEQKMPFDIVVQSQEYNNNALYIDSMGKERKREGIENWQQPKNMNIRHFILLNHCVEIVGAEKILALYPIQIKLMQKYNTPKINKP